MVVDSSTNSDDANLDANARRAGNFTVKLMLSFRFLSVYMPLHGVRVPETPRQFQVMLVNDGRQDMIVNLLLPCFS